MKQLLSLFYVLIHVQAFASSGYIDIYSTTSFNLDVVMNLPTDTTDMDASTTWYSSSFSGNFADGDCRLQIDITKAFRDTIIGDRLCRVIGVTANNTYLTDSEVITYEKDNKLYFFEDGNWKLLYDYNAEVGDTVSYSISKKYPYYDPFTLSRPFEQSVLEGNPYHLVIEHIDTVYSNGGVPLKRFFTNNLSNITGHRMDTIIQHVGSLYKFFGRNGFVVPPECTDGIPNIRCYQDSSINISFVDTECNKLTATSEHNSSFPSFYPNPGTDILHISLPPEGTSGDLHFTIHDISGKPHLYGRLHEGTPEIDTAALPSGIYIVTVTDSSGKHRRGKWVKM